MRAIPVVHYPPRYAVWCEFVGGKLPMLLQTCETRRDARDWAACWTLDAIFRRDLPEAAEFVVVRCHGGKLDRAEVSRFHLNSVFYADSADVAN